MATPLPTAQTDVAPPSSRWARALEGDTEALRELAASYWYAVYVWWRRSGSEEAGALTQACFTRWLTIAPPHTSHPSAARFREWLLAQLPVLAAEGVEPAAETALEIAVDWAEERYAQEPAGTADEIFQRRWALTILEFAMESLRAEYAERGQEALFAEVSQYAGFEGADAEHYSATATRLGVTAGSARKAVFDFRSRHQQLLREFIVDTVADPNEINSELTALLVACDAGGGQAPLPSAIRSFKPDELLARAMRSVRMTSGASVGLWTPPSDDEVARLFPQYEILGLLGRGGMGAVYQARQLSLDRIVAIKLLPLEISVDQDFGDRFRREARAMAKLNHPNIISVHDFGQTSEGHLYFVMEFVEGPMLHTLIHGAGGLPPESALELVGQVCEALAYAHERGVVHRDIKPANVMVDAHGRVKVADFGLARMAGPDPTQWGSTMTGVVMGTPDYMAPEQKRGQHVDHRADIYALGVMLYEALCRETPQGAFEMPSKKCGLDKRLDAIITKALATQAEARYQTTLEMKTAIETVRPSVVKAQAKRGGGAATSASTVVAPAALARRAWLPWAAGLAVLAIAAGIGSHFISSKSAAPEPPAAPASASSAVATGGRDWSKAIDLLSMIDPQRDAVSGEWTLNGGVLKTAGAPNARLQLPYEPPAEYDFRIVFSNAPNKAVRKWGQVLQLASGAHSFQWIIGPREVDGEPGGPLARMGKLRQGALEKWTTHSSIVEVRTDGVKAYLDDRLAAEWKPGERALMPEWQLRNENRLGLGSGDAALIFERIDVREVSGTGRAPRPHDGPGQPPPPPRGTDLGPPANGAPPQRRPPKKMDGEMKPAPPAP